MRQYIVKAESSEPATQIIVIQLPWNNNYIWVDIFLNIAIKRTSQKQLKFDAPTVVKFLKELK